MQLLIFIAIAALLALWADVGRCARRGGILPTIMKPRALRAAVTPAAPALTLVLLCVSVGTSTRGAPLQTADARQERVKASVAPAARRTESPGYLDGSFSESVFVG